MGDPFVTKRGRYYVIHFYDSENVQHRISTRKTTLKEAATILSEWTRKIREQKPFLKKYLGEFNIFYFENGYLLKNRTGTKDYKLATELLEQFLIDNNMDRKHRIVSLKLSEFLENYLSVMENSLSKATLAVIKTSVKELKKIIGDKHLHMITIYELDNFFSVKAKNASESTANCYRRHLSLMMNKAVLWNNVKENIVKKTSKLDEPPSVLRFFSKEEFKILLASLETEYERDIVTFAVFTGMRIGELRNLLVSEVDLNKRIIHITNKSKLERAKNRKERSIDLADNLVPIVEKYSSNTYLFEKNGKVMSTENISKRFKQAVRISGLEPGLHFHNLRSTFGKWLLDAEVPIEIISHLLGHSDITVTQKHYARHLNTKRNLGIINKII